MKKSLLALAVAASWMGLAQAQTNVTIYGILDTGIVKETGVDTQMAQWEPSRIGFKGTEDLGNSYKATFQLEKRFTVNDGNMVGNEWEGASNVGLAGGFGHVRMGRVNEVALESFRRIDPFSENGMASVLQSSMKKDRISNTIRYDSPNYNGFYYKATYSLGHNTDEDSRDALGETLKAKGADHDGYALSLNYDNQTFALLANFNRFADSNHSFNWNVGGWYKTNGFKIGLGYERTNDRGWQLGNASGHMKDTSLTSKQDAVILGAQYTTGPHTFMGAASYMHIKDIESERNALKDKSHAQKYALGYTYAFSKRTSLYGQLAYTDYGDTQTAQFYRGEKFTNNSVTGLAIGMNHKF